ncbi:hypothetical protein LEP3755_66760 (plasmid) [Leptolyngbya sp. NIES-3755]|nr:hypothetical protein LEP3755_66760 [Leptolyngbya sp. NIES-3755]
MTLTDALIAYDRLRQQHSQQIDPALQALHTQIEQQISELQAEEQGYLDAQNAALSSLRPQIEADARCLLSTQPFIAFVLERTTQRSQYRLGERLPVDPDPQQWQLAMQPLPLQIVGYEQQRDDHAYNDENHYTQYSYEMTVQLGSWRKTIDVDTASLSPGHPMRYQRDDIDAQYYDVAYRLIDIDRYRAVVPTESEFTELQLDAEQVRQLKEEMSYLLAFVGDLFHLQSPIESFCYPQMRN